MQLCRSEIKHTILNVTSLCVFSFQYAPAIFTADKNSYFLLLSQNDGAAGSFRHVAKIDAHVDLKVHCILLYL